MARAPVGQRIRKRRQELGRRRSRLAARVGISASYLNLIEHNKRAIGGTLLNRIADGDRPRQPRARRHRGGATDRRAHRGRRPTSALIRRRARRRRTPREIVATSPIAARAILGALPRLSRGAAPLRPDRRAARRGFVPRRGEPSDPVADHHHPLLRGDPEGLRRSHRGGARALHRHAGRGERDGSPPAPATCSTSSADAARRRPRPSPREEIEDFISDRANYFPRLEAAARGTLGRGSATPVRRSRALARHLAPPAWGHGRAARRRRTCRPAESGSTDGRQLSRRRHALAAAASASGSRVSIGYARTSASFSTNSSRAPRFPRPTPRHGCAMRSPAISPAR